jgi:hypothetical protein
MTMSKVGSKRKITADNVQAFIDAFNKRPVSRYVAQRLTDLIAQHKGDELVAELDYITAYIKLNHFSVWQLASARVFDTSKKSQTHCTIKIKRSQLDALHLIFPDSTREQCLERALTEYLDAVPHDKS